MVWLPCGHVGQRPWYTLSPPKMAGFPGFAAAETRLGRRAPAAKDAPAKPAADVFKKRPPRCILVSHFALPPELVFSRRLASLPPASSPTNIRQRVREFSDFDIAKLDALGFALQANVPDLRIEHVRLIGHMAIHRQHHATVVDHDLELVPLARRLDSFFPRQRRRSAHGFANGKHGAGALVVDLHLQTLRKLLASIPAQRKTPELASADVSRHSSRKT